MTKEEVSATRVCDVPGIPPRMFRRFLEEQGEDIDEEPLENRARSDYWTVGYVASIYSLGFYGTGSRQIKKFCLDNGLSRVDWIALPYRERQVMRALSKLPCREIEKLNILVFGFLEAAGETYVKRICGVPPGAGWHYAKISGFLRWEGFKPSERHAARYRRVADLLRSLGFDYPTTRTGRERITREIMERDGLSRPESENFVKLCELRHYIPKIQLL